MMTGAESKLAKNTNHTHRLGKGNILVSSHETITSTKVNVKKIRNNDWMSNAKFTDFRKLNSPLRYKNDGTFNNRYGYFFNKFTFTYTVSFAH